MPRKNSWTQPEDDYRNKQFCEAINAGMTKADDDEYAGLPTPKFKIRRTAGAMEQRRRVTGLEGQPIAKPAPEPKVAWVKPTLLDLFKAVGLKPSDSVMQTSYPHNGMVCKLDNGLTVEVRNGE